MKKKVLAIDDEQIILDSVLKILTVEDYEVDVTLNSTQGLDWGLKRDYDIVLTDIRMPGIDGMKILRDIKRLKPSLPVLIITGYASVKSAVQAMKLGAMDYLEKPFTPDELLNAIHSALDMATTQKPEKQDIIHKSEILKVLERAATDNEFLIKLSHQGPDALEEFDLTPSEKLALLTGDIDWIEEQIGPLKATQKKWFENFSDGF
ncbi:MAG: response regulator [Thermodesulfobacteriota bacterium]|nr:response regulator [Thermodesulfobacteriota bacterium]